jgi:ABC-type multidrug transport system ATPase subunit
MSVAVELIGFSLRPDGRGVSASLQSGRIIALCGRAGAGKSHLLNALTGNVQPALGRIRLIGSASFSDGSSLPRKSTPQAIAKRAGGKESPDRMSVVLTLLSLWDEKQTPLDELSSSQKHAAELIPLLMSNADVVLIDGGLDVLDLVVRDAVFGYMKQRATSGQTWLLATHIADLAQKSDDLIVLRAGNVQFCGSVETFATEREPVTVDVQTSNAPSVKALVEPFAIDLEERANGLRFRARKGQSLAARLLLQGYGDVRVVTVKQPRFEDLLRDIL